MSSFVNFLKSLFSGLFSFFGGSVGSKKDQAAIEGSAPKPRKNSKSGYFLELDEAKGVGSAAPAKSVAASAPAKSVAAPAPAKAESNNGATAKPAVATEAKAAPKTSGANAALNLPQPTVTTFAPKYLAQAGSANGRRRPGANMSSFLDMARQVKTPS